MTDKQIRTPQNEVIINGVDVSGCIYFKKNNKMPMCRACNSGVGSPYCEYHKDCYYKQLKRKEQECEELKEEIDDLKEIIQRHDNDNNALLSEFEDDLVDYYRRYKECLAEIKEIVKNMNNECFYDDFECKDCDMKNGCTYFNKKQILQKISEVENE